MDFDETLPMVPDETQYYAPDAVPDAVPDAGVDEAWCPPKPLRVRMKAPKSMILLLAMVMKVSAFLFLEPDIG